MLLYFTDGSKYAVGCGKQSQSNSFANCPAGVLECFYIDVQGGEVVSGKSLGYNRPECPTINLYMSSIPSAYIF